MKYFAYGSNMLTLRLEKRVGRVDVLGIAKLAQYQLCFNKPSKDGSLKANAFFTGDEHHFILGVLFSINEDKKLQLDIAEGLGKGYDQKDIIVKLTASGEDIPAFTYVATKVDNSGLNQTYDWYKDLVYEGAKEHNLPEHYLSQIERVDTKEDPNIGRRDINLFILKERGLQKKYLSPSFRLITNLMKSGEYKIHIADHVLNDRTIQINHHDKKLSFDTSTQVIPGLQTHHELKIGKRELQLLDLIGTRQLHVEGQNFLIDTITYNEDHEKVLTGSIYAAGTASSNHFKGKYHRVVIPIDDTLKIDRDYECYPFLLDFSLTRGLLKVHLSGKEFHIYQARFDKKEYAVIDSLEVMDLKEFQHYCQVILLTYAFISGDYHSGEAYFLAFDDREFYTTDLVQYQCQGSSHLKIAAAYTTNPYSIVQYESSREEDIASREEKIKKLREELIFFPATVFNKICEIALDSEKVFRALLLLIFNEKSTLEMKIPVQYVAIEALTGAIVTKGNKELKPVEDPAVASELVQLLSNQAADFLRQNNIPVENNEMLTPLFKRLTTLNAPTNIDKLTKPFTQLGFDISNDEKKIIKLRDTFLHGSIKTYGGLEQGLKKLFYISSKLHFLICVLILKHAGFEGRIINYPKLYEHITEEYLDEEILKKI